ncbi:MAG: glycosyltransferase family 61 protein [Gammaproteobacteria bacterium]|nr:MAG: glycosyltransferase family 61 protein [Gammaproteobacteria bacterium]
MLKKMLHRWGRSPVAYPDIASLYDAHTAARHLEGIVEVQPYKRVVSHAPYAEPERIERGMGPYEGYWLRDVWVWPETGIIRTVEGKLIAETLPSRYRFLKMLRAGAYRYEPGEGDGAVVDQRVASLGGGRWYGHYYHWLVDELPRIVGLDHAPEVECLYVPCAYPDPIFDLVRNLVPDHIDVRRAPGRQQWIFARRYFHAPALTEDYCGFLPERFVSRLREVLHDHGTDRSYDRKVYISRAGASKRRVLNEDDVIEVLATYGFEAVQAEKMSFHDQVRLFAEARHIIGPHGAGLTNMMFARQCTVLELFPGAPFTHYRWLSASLGHAYGCLCGPTERGKHDDFDVDLDMLKKKIEVFIR